MKNAGKTMKKEELLVLENKRVSEEQSLVMQEIEQI